MSSYLAMMALLGREGAHFVGRSIGGADRAGRGA